MTANEIVDQLRLPGSDSYKRVLFNHGVQEPCFGVKIADLRKIRNRIRMENRLAGTS